MRCGWPVPRTRAGMAVAGALPGLTPEEARWCGPALTARVAAGVWGRLPELLRHADEHWPALGATLAERTRTC